MGDTKSTINLTKWLREYFLAYENSAGESIHDIIGERFYDSRARDTQITWPYAVARLQTSNDGKYHGLRLNGDYEVQIFGRPYAMYEDVSKVGDVMDQAARQLVLQSSGLVLCHGFQRATLQPGSGAIDSEVVTIRLAYTLAIWPQFLTNS